MPRFSQKSVELGVNKMEECVIKAVMVAWLRTYIFLYPEASIIPVVHALTY